MNKLFETDIDLNQLHTILEFAQRYMTHFREDGFDKYIELNGELILYCEKLLKEKAREEE